MGRTNLLFLSAIALVGLVFSVSNTNAQQAGGFDLSKFKLEEIINPLEQGGYSNKNFSKEFFYISLTPSTPGSHEKVSAVVTSHSANLNETTLTWYVDGKKVLSGTAERNYSFTTKGPGETTTIRVVGENSVDGTAEVTTSITPSEVDIVWVADTYVPPFYKGKALPSSESMVRVVAIPNFSKNGVKISSDRLVYTWKKSYYAVAGGTMGKKSFSYKAGFPNNISTISVFVTTPDKSLSREVTAAIPVEEPKILFYEKHPLEGIKYESALGGKFVLSEKNEITLAAEPYFFSFFKKNENGTEYVWNIDRVKMSPSSEKKSEFTLGKPSSGSGKANIELSISNPATMFQKSKGSISIEF